MKRYTDAEKAEAVELYRTEGPTAVQKQLGIPKGTVTRWAQSEGTETMVTEKTAAANEARVVGLEKRRLRLADGLLDDAVRLRAELFAPCTERVVKTVSTGHGMSEAEIVDVKRKQPTFADQRQIMTAIAIAVDKVQLLTGAATERVETLAADREQVESRVGKLLTLVPHERTG